jgi:Fur family transcriptional regulator, ferric uptake regulator
MDNPVFQRNTKQRRLILNELRGVTSHPTAQELYNMVISKLPGISLSTVYRNLEAMVEQGIVHKLDNSGGKSRFDGDIQPHSHIHCLSCGSVHDAAAPPDSLMEDYKVQLDEFEVVSWRLDFHGICPECQVARGQTQN